MIEFVYDDGDQGASPMTVIDVQDDPDLSELLGADDVVIAEREIELDFTYPMSHPVRMTFRSDNGFTRRRLAVLIYETYREIYGLEDSVSRPSREGSVLLNRGESNGPYGIWGHYITDLILEGVEHVQGKRYVVAVGS